LNWNLPGGKTGHNVLYGRYTGSFAGTVAQANVLHAGIGSGSAWTALAALMPTTVAFAGVSIRNVSVEDQPIILSSTGVAAGTAVAAELPNEMAVCITLRTALTGPSNRGRLFLPGLAQTTVAAGNLVSAAAVTAINTWAATISGVFSGAGYTWVIGQKARVAYTGSTGTQHPARAATSVPITAASSRDNHWDSQRRRGLR
jgi:hypothetical protein